MEYKGIHIICFGCGVYGHAKENCPKLRSEKESNEVSGSKSDGSKEVKAMEKSHPVEAEKPKEDDVMEKIKILRNMVLG